MIEDALPPFVSWYTDRHGKRRYRFRRKGEAAVSLPGQPGSDTFQAAYAKALAGQLPVRQTPSRRPRYQPRTLAAAWALVRSSIEWKQLKPISQAQQAAVAERFLAMRIAETEPETFGQMPFEGLRRAGIKKILARYDRPHAAEAVLRLLRKLCLAALDAEWIEHDPTHRIKFRPKLKGHRAWTDAELATFESRWPIGTPQRLGYALALYTGQRRSDVAAMTWTQIDGDAITVVQEKTDAPLVIPAHPELQAILEQTPRLAERVLVGAHKSGYTRESFGNLMAEAIEKARLPDDCRLHGLRKAAGRCLAEAGASTRQIMAVLGHKTIKEAENYTREAEQKRLARDGIAHWARPKLAVIK